MSWPVIPSVGIPGMRLTDAGEDGAHVILRREDAEGPQNARVSHFEVLRRASPAQDDVGIFSAARDPGVRWLEDHASCPHSPRSLATLGMTLMP
jgi:hypothetical protein